MGRREGIARVAEVQPVGPDRGGGVALPPSRHAPHVFRGSAHPLKRRALSLSRWRAREGRSDGDTIREKRHCVLCFPNRQQPRPAQLNGCWKSRRGMSAAMPRHRLLNRRSVLLEKPHALNLPRTYGVHWQSRAHSVQVRADVQPPREKTSLNGFAWSLREQGSRDLVSF
jgi:hypothetical protein